MRYAIFFDAHIGAEGWERWYPSLRAAVDQERTRGARIVWGGDTLDYVEDSQIRPPEGLFRPEDLWLVGNHDPYAYPGLEARYAWSADGVYIVHGDQTDLQYACALLEGAGSQRIHRGTAYAIYRALVGAPDWATRVARTWFFRLLHHERPPTPWRLFSAFAPALALVALHEEPRLYPPPGELPRLPVWTRDPQALVAKLLALEPGAAQAHTLVMGHLHPVPYIDAQVGGQRLVVAPAWPTYPYAGYVVVESGQVEVVLHA